MIDQHVRMHVILEPSIWLSQPRLLLSSVVKASNWCTEGHIGSIGHFTVVYGSEAEGELVLIQTFLLYYVNQVILMLTSIFQEHFP